MSRESISGRLISAVGRGIGFGLAAGAAFLAASEIPGIKRYAHLLWMAKRGSRTRAVATRDPESDAQAPRRAGETDGHHGHERRGDKRPAQPSPSTRA